MHCDEFIFMKTGMKRMNPVRQDAKIFVNSNLGNLPLPILFKK